MTLLHERRRFLLSLAAGVAMSQAPFALARAQSRRASLASTPLPGGLILISGAGGNVVVGHDGEGALMVDGGTADRARDLEMLVLRETGVKRVHTLINTHWHPEQTGSNERLGKAGAKIIAHENTRLWLTVSNPLVGQSGTYGPLPAAARPNATTYANGSLRLGADQVDYGYLLQAHTDGDLYVHFRQANLLVAGDVVCNDGWPVIDWRTGGWIGGMVDGLTKLIALSDATTRIVPGRGPLLTRSDLEVQRTQYATIFERLEALLRQGKGPDEALAENPTKEFNAEQGDPTQFVTLAFESMWGHYAPNA
jgi:glyoxylase-like metal-dependent hydrolase (beta-lactamase superfamily II)